MRETFYSVLYKVVPVLIGLSLGGDAEVPQQAVIGKGKDLQNPQQAFSVQPSALFGTHFKMGSNTEEYGYVHGSLIDPLYQIAEQYLQNNSPVASFQKSLEDYLGINILGEPLHSDLEDVANTFEQHKKRKFVGALEGIKLSSLIIFPSEYRSRVDYIGLSDKEGATVRLFSLEIEEGILLHELIHFRIWQMEKENPAFIEKWDAVAGPYEHVVLGQMRGFVGVKSYKDGTQGARFGYICPYGGKDRQEDIATMAVAAIKEPLEFFYVQDTFDVYRQKLALLAEEEFITGQELETAIAYIEFAGMGE